MMPSNHEQPVVPTESTRYRVRRRDSGGPTGTIVMALRVVLPRDDRHIDVAGPGGANEDRRRRAMQYYDVLVDEPATAPMPFQDALDAAA